MWVEKSSSRTVLLYKAIRNTMAEKVKIVQSDEEKRETILNISL